MTKFSQKNYTRQLQQLMQQAGISSFTALSRKAKVSERQVNRLRLGLVLQMKAETLVKLSGALQVPVSDLLSTFSTAELVGKPASDEASAALKQEYQRLLSQLEQQRESLKQEFQQSSLQALESWMLQWPTAARAAQQNPQLPAANLLRLVRPVEQLLLGWGVEAIASVGDEIPYDPQWHQLMESTAQPGETVRVRYTGYRQGDQLLYRAKVSLISPR